MNIAHALCWRAANRGHVMPGSVRVPCDRCAEPVWLAPSSVMPDHVTIAVCIPCATDQEVRDAAAQPLTPVQVEEIRRYARGKS
jgi:hypothetical protein